jgi:hypothetical protein
MPPQVRQITKVMLNQVKAGCRERSSLAYSNSVPVNVSIQQRVRDTTRHVWRGNSARCTGLRAHCTVIGCNTKIPHAAFIKGHRGGTGHELSIDGRTKGKSSRKELVARLFPAADHTIQDAGGCRAWRASTRGATHARQIRCVPDLGESDVIRSFCGRDLTNRLYGRRLICGDLGP